MQMTAAAKESKRLFTSIQSILDWLGNDVEYAPVHGDGAGVYTLVALTISSEIPKSVRRETYRYYSVKLKDKKANSYLIVGTKDIKKAVTANGNCP